MQYEISTINVYSIKYLMVNDRYISHLNFFVLTGNGAAGQTAQLIFNPSPVMVSESAGPAMVCVELDLGPAAVTLGCDLTVTLNFMDGTAGSYILACDYCTWYVCVCVCVCVPVCLSVHDYIIVMLQATFSL